jgi:hypothetical protein
VALIDCVVAPVDHRYDEPALAVSVTDPPAQNVVGPPAVTVATGSGFTVTVTGEPWDEQPFAFVTETEYWPAWETVIDCVVAPVDQRYVKPAGAFSVTLPPAQNVVGPPAAITGAAGSGFSVTTTGVLVAEQPFALVTVTL